ncbi:unnamed protein product [Polarella glacialis]|uniref:Uncharacterized protein n=1 Tax=Polarella glacialis TaxID=89957 RepID=A0A813F4A9_POLGL|nr:unnamed protein product [Polarella glacialis]CAE8736552.1 unnamed protein product [Polarella glacialis]
MAMRPWNVFKKTMYVVSAQGEGASNSLLAAQLSQARARLQEQEASRFSSPFRRNLALLLGPSAAVWLLLLGSRWRYADEERLKSLESQSGGAMLLDLLAWRFLAHLGPYQIPNFSRAKLHEDPLKMLQEPVLLDHERVRALNRLEQLSQRRMAVQFLAPAGEQPSPGSPLRAIEPLLFDTFYTDEASATKTAGTSSDSHRAASARIILDVVTASEPEDRSVPPWVLSGLVAVKGLPWEVGPQGSELRSTLLLQLLRTPSNSMAAATLPDVCKYLAHTGFKKKEETVWPLKAYLLSGENPDLLRKGARLVNKQVPDAVEPALRRERDTPSLQIKRDLRGFWTTGLMTAGWAIFRGWTAIFTIQANLQLAAGTCGALAGMAVLETLWRTEEQVIQSQWYWEDSYGTIPASAAMVLVNCTTLAWAARLGCIPPFLFSRFVKDGYMDTYRTFDT